jgi:hypothetical protein
VRTCRVQAESKSSKDGRSDKSDLASLNKDRDNHLQVHGHNPAVIRRSSLAATSAASYSTLHDAPGPDPTMGDLGLILSTTDPQLE